LGDLPGNIVGQGLEEVLNISGIPTILRKRRIK
jgi:hypothetical protein